MLRDALELTKQMVRELPDDYDTLLLQAQVFFKAGEERKAEKIILQLTEQTPFVSRAFLALGEIYQSQERFEEAIHVLIIDASDLLARYDRACYLAQLNRNEEAKEELEFVLREDESGFFAELIEDDENLAALREFEK